MPDAVIDASVAVRWFVSGPLAQVALEQRYAWAGHAPAFLTVETAHALGKYVRAGLMEVDVACDVVELLADELSLTPDVELLPAAQRMAADLNHSVYDCLYAVLAARLAVPLITADLKFAERAATIPGMEVKMLRTDS